MTSNRLHTNRGVTLIEIVAAAVIGSLLAGGTLMAFVMATRVTRGSVTTVEASDYAVQTIERFRNRIACDDTGAGGWFDANCGFLDQAATPDEGWNLTDSTLAPNSPTRTYQIEAADCDGDGTDGDCYKMTVTVGWSPPSS